MSILAAFMVPHPPMIVPQVGKGSERQVRKTTEAYEQVAAEIAELQPDTIILTSPHSVMYSDYFHISPGKGARGSFADFRAGEVRFDEVYDSELVGRLEALAQERGISAGTLGERDRRLDHGTMVPLYFIRKHYTGGRLVRIGLSGLPLTQHYEFGMMIRDAVEELGRRAVFVASGDLSHKLQSYGPYGFAPEGPQYDERIMDVCSGGDFGKLFDFDEAFCERAAECGHRSFVIMAGALDGQAVEARQLSHEDVTGVGYGICTFYPKGEGPGRHFLDDYLMRQAEELSAQRKKEDPFVQLARASVECAVRRGRRLKLAEVRLPEGLPQELLERRAGAFVSIHEHGRLRGCIGTISPTADCLAEEIIGNAVSASLRDPRFEPISPKELPWLEISVDVLGEPEPVESEAELDVKRYGVIVTKGAKRGLLLPDLDGVDTVSQQVSIACRKAGITPGSKVKLERFEVVRHY